jgi:5-methylcytosine-specific restriction endonuclease McrA
VSEHNRGESCTKQSACTCPKCCRCYQCLFMRRSTTLYSGMRSRLQERRYKSGPREGKVRVAKQFLPFTPENFRDWLRVVLEDEPFCSYCKEPINILTISPDHRTPLSRGGSLELANICGACVTCNTRKGRLKPGEFMFLRECVATLPEAARGDIWRRLTAGGGTRRIGAPRVAQTVKPRGLSGGDVIAMPAILNREQ